MTLKRAIIQGDYIQAVGFRESITSALRKMGYRGTARNIRDKDEVWLEVLEGDKKFGEKEFDEILGKIREKNPLIGDKITRRIEEIRDDTTEKQIERFEKPDTFKIIREDDLHEMVWALLGAGNLFRHTSEEVKELLDIKKTEKQTQLNAISIELDHAQDSISKTNASYLAELICLNGFLSNPKIDLDGQTLGKFIEFYNTYKEFAAGSEAEKMQRKGTMLAQIDELQELIRDSLNSRKTKTRTGESNGKP